MKKLKEKINFLNKNYKTEITRLLIIDFLICVSFIFLIIYSKNLLILIYFFGILVFFNFFYLTRYQRIINKNNANLINDFINTFSYFRIYISNNMNAYNAFKEVSKYSSPFIKTKLLVLLDEIDEDKSLKPYMNFAKNFNNKKVEEVMIAIYEMVNEGISENYLNQFTSVFTSFKARVEKTNQEKRFSKFNLINAMSMGGMMLIMILIMLSIVNMVGEIAIWVTNYHYY